MADKNRRGKQINDALYDMDKQRRNKKQFTIENTMQ